MQLPLFALTAGRVAVPLPRGQISKVEPRLSAGVLGRRQMLPPFTRSTIVLCGKKGSRERDAVSANSARSRREALVSTQDPRKDRPSLIVMPVRQELHVGEAWS